RLHEPLTRIGAVRRPSRQPAGSTSAGGPAGRTSAGHVWKPEPAARPANELVRLHAQCPGPGCPKHGREESPTGWPGRTPAESQPGRRVERARQWRTGELPTDRRHLPGASARHSNRFALDDKLHRERRNRTGDAEAVDRGSGPEGRGVPLRRSDAGFRDPRRAPPDRPVHRNEFRPWPVDPGRAEHASRTRSGRRPLPWQEPAIRRLSPRRRVRPHVRRVGAIHYRDHRPGRVPRHASHRRRPRRPDFRNTVNRVRRILPFVALAAVLAIGLPLFLRTPVWVDVTYHDLSAWNVLHRGVHYRDVFETNLP